MTEALWLSLWICLALSVCHLAAVPLWLRLRSHSAEVASFSGGAASAYVFLHLLPELESTHATIGERVYAIILVGFVLLYALDTVVSSIQGGELDGNRFRIRIGFAALYNLLLAFTMSEQLPLSPGTAVAYALALSLHVISVNLTLVEGFGPKRHASGRFVLAGATLAGWILSLLTDAPKAILDILTALMAGFIIFTVFAEELPSRGGVRLLWFIIGTSMCVILELLAHA